MNKTPNQNQNHSKSGSFFSKLKAKFSFILQDAVKKVIDEEKNNLDSWDDDIKNHYPPDDYTNYQSTQKPYSTTDNNNQEDFFISSPHTKSGSHRSRLRDLKPDHGKKHSFPDDEYVETPPEVTNKKKSIKPLLFMIFGLVILALLTVLWFKNSNNKRLNLAPVGKSYDSEPGYKKLDKPILGKGPSSSHEQVDETLGKIDFDFSRIVDSDIARTPMLPDKMADKKSKKIVSEYNEFENIWDNNQTNKDTSGKITSNTSSNSDSFLPPWRRFSGEYLPTDGLPSYSIILRYNPNIMNVSDLPDGNGYNVVLPGYMKYSAPLVKQLRAKKYEVILYLPMDNDGGKLSVKPIKFGSAFDVIRQSIAYHSSQLGGNGFVGFMNYGGAKVRRSLPEMNFLMSLLAKTGYMYVDFIQDNQKSLAFASAEGQNVPVVKTTHFINSVQNEFPKFIKHIKLDGLGVAVIDATPENIVALQQYEPALRSEKVRRIPVSAIVKHKMLKETDFE